MTDKTAQQLAADRVKILLHTRDDLEASQSTRIIKKYGHGHTLGTNEEQSRQQVRRFLGTGRLGRLFLLAQAGAMNGAQESFW